MSQKGKSMRDRFKEKREKDRKKREKIMKDKMIKNKQKELKEKQKEQQRNNEGNSGTGLNNIGDNESIENLQKELDQLRKERANLDKKTIIERVQDLKGLIKKVRNFWIKAGIVIKVAIVLFIPTLIAVAFFLVSTVIASVILPVGAFVVLTDEEGGDVAVTNRGISLEESIGDIRNDEEFIEGSVWVVPFTKNITSDFGSRKHPILKTVRNHNGIDIAAGNVRGKEVVAYQSGKVVTSKYNIGGYGYYVVIQHGDNYQTLYAHLDKKGIDVGTTVSAGDVIGKVGTSGMSTGPHLHFEVRVKDSSGEFKPVNPKKYIEHLR